MCKPTQTNLNRKHSLLLTTKSFESDDSTTPQPTLLSTWMTIGVVVALLVGVEQLINYVLTTNQDVHPILENKTNRQILARHIGVDTFSCMIVAYLGLKNINICQDLITCAKGKKSMPRAGYETRLFTYHPASQQICLVFFAYQVKNMYDTIVWNDGIIFVLHHIFAGASAYGAMHPGAAHFYAIFFLGISEISTAILCILANFDDEHGVPGLADAFPIARVIVAACFVVAFICCRTIIWPYVGYHFLFDALAALKSDTTSYARKIYLRMLIGNFSFLTLLQFAWLIQIGLTIREEAIKLFEE